MEISGERIWDFEPQHQPEGDNRKEPGPNFTEINSLDSERCSHKVVFINVENAQRLDRIGMTLHRFVIERLTFDQLLWYGASTSFIFSSNSFCSASTISESGA